jgi:hypothetical protein
MKNNNMKSTIFLKKNYLFNSVIILLVFSIFTIATVTAQVNNNGPQTIQPTQGGTDIEREGIDIGVEREGENLPLPPPPPINTTYVDPYAGKSKLKTII